MPETDEVHSNSIRNWPESERPRERLLEKGAEALSNAELLAILIGHGNRQRSAVDLAKEVLKGRLRNISASGLRSIPGLGPAKIARILAALELGRRTLGETQDSTPRLTNSLAVADFVRPKILGVARELFYVISVDVKNRPVGMHEIARGGAEGVQFHPREIFAEPIRLQASGIICVHNHPSGDPAPSFEDRALTDRLKSSAQLLGLRFLDHVIVTAGGHYSFVEKS